MTAPRPGWMCAALEREIENASRPGTTTSDALCARHGRGEGPALRDRRAARFSPGYRGTFPAHEAARDLAALEELAADNGPSKIRAQVWRQESDGHSALRIKLYVLGEVLPLSASLPVFENLGLKVIAEDSFPVSFNRDGGWRQEAVILDFPMERADGGAADLDQIREPLEDAFHAVLRGRRKAMASTGW